MFRDDRAVPSQDVTLATAATERLITQLQEDLIHERSVVASLQEQIRLYQAFDVSAQSGGEEVDLSTFKPIQRRSHPLSMMKTRATQILREQHKKAE